MTTKDIIERFDEFAWYSAPHNLLEAEGISKDGIRYKLRQENIKQFISSSLTELLDSIEKELPKEKDWEEIYEIGRNDYRKEVINIINSHR